MQAPDLDEKTKKKIIDTISALIPDTKIYLFGSRARGTHSEWSDIDIVLDAGHELALRSVGESNDVMAALSIAYVVQIVDFYKVSKAMQQSIVKDKVIWKA